MECLFLREVEVLPHVITCVAPHSIASRLGIQPGDTLVKITDYNPRNKKIYAVGDSAYVAFEKENIHVL